MLTGGAIQVMMASNQSPRPTAPLTAPDDDRLRLSRSVDPASTPAPTSASASTPASPSPRRGEIDGDPGTGTEAPAEPSLAAPAVDPSSGPASPETAPVIGGARRTGPTLGPRRTRSVALWVAIAASVSLLGAVLAPSSGEVDLVADQTSTTTALDPPIPPADLAEPESAAADGAEADGFDPSALVDESVGPEDSASSDPASGTTTTLDGSSTDPPLDPSTTSSTGSSVSVPADATANQAEAPDPVGTPESTAGAPSGPAGSPPDGAGRAAPPTSNPSSNPSSSPSSSPSSTPAPTPTPTATPSPSSPAPTGGSTPVVPGGAGQPTAPTTPPPTTAPSTSTAPDPAPSPPAPPSTPPSGSAPGLPRYGSSGEGSTSLDDCTVTVAGGDLSAQIDAAPAGAVVCLQAGDHGGHLLQVTSSDRTVKAAGRVEVGAVVVEADRVTIDGLRVTGASDLSGRGAAVEVTGTGNVVHNVLVDAAPTRNGIVCGSRTDCADTVFSHNSVTGIESIGIIIYGSGNRVERNNVWGLARTSGGYDVDAMRFFGRGHLIRENYFHDIDEFASVTSGGDTPHVDCWQTYTIFESYNPNRNPIVTADVTIENNYCVRIGRQCLIMSNAHTDAVLVRNITFRNNVCETYDSQVVNLQGVVDVFIENNYLGGDPTYQVLALSLSGANGAKRNSGVVIRNNIIQRARDNVAVLYGERNGDGTVVEGNHVLTGPSRINRSADFPGSGRGAAFPAITESDFTQFAQQADRVDVVDRGTTAARPHSLDLAGRTRIQGSIDIGPYELG